mmetsp:Transcript_89212/g.158150  ORF Transcript_89212/g.158150 Transcript_89212/m.158150 type:complete len:360 (-) Transcript_89212:119-1198(-)
MGSGASAEPAKDPSLEPTPLTPVSKAHMALSKVAVTDAKQFREDKEDYLLQTFKQWDKNGDGQLSLQELSKVLQTCGIDYSQTEMQKLMAAVDLDKNGTVEFEEFSSWLSSCPSLSRYFNEIASLYEDLEVKLEKLSADGDMEKYEAVRARAREKADAKLIPLIDEVFVSNDRDGNEVLDEDESVLFFGNFVGQLMKKPGMVEALVGLVTCTSYEDVISEVCQKAFGSKSGRDLTEAQQVVVEYKNRFEVQIAILERRHEIDADADRQKASYREAFKVIDANGDGCLCKEEVRECLLPSAKNDSCRKFLAALGLMATDDELKIMAEQKLLGLLKEEQLAVQAQKLWQKLHPPQKAVAAN